jgi:predicted nucleic acid-binding protein
VARFVISDAAPLICLAQVGGLPWLEYLFDQVHITHEVRDEILPGLGKPGEEILSQAIEQGLLSMHPEWNWTEPVFPSLGRGEQSCIRAAVNLANVGNGSLILIDDLEARRLAASLSIPITGTAAVVRAARKADLVQSAQAFSSRFVRMDSERRQQSSGRS